MSIIQWNFNSYRENRPELECLLVKNPAVVCLQETRASEPIKMKGYKSYNVYSKTADDRACGGVSILVNDKVAQKRILINSNIQCAAVRVSLHKTLTICCIYIPPSQSFAIDDLDHIKNQLPGPVMFVGDFNAHHITWGNNRSTPKGIIVDNFVSKNSLNIMNDGSFTYLHSGNGARTAIDLSICDPSLYLDFQWRVSDDLSGSDHFPIFIDPIIPQPILSTPHFIFAKANWELFTQCCETEITQEVFSDNKSITNFSEKLIEIADKCIPSSSGKTKKRKRPWFDKDCKDTINDRKNALSNFQKSPTNENLITFKLMKAKARRAVRNAKRQSWQEYVSKLNNQTPMKNVWDMIGKISGKYKKDCLNMLEKDGNTISDPNEIADCLAESFARNSSSENYSDEFQTYKNKTEKQKLNFKTKSLTEYNKKITIKELMLAIKKSKNTSPGPDQIHYQLLKHLPISCLFVLLDLLNDVWEGGEFPPAWRDAIVVPIPKPGKDSQYANNYRPISLTSCLCKTMERIINDRLVYYLEKNNLLTALQSGFRKSRSTTDHLVRLESYIRQSFKKGEHCVGVFFDLEKAYDMTWKYGIMKDLFDLGLRGNLPIFIDKFLHGRFFKVRVGSTLSLDILQEQGVPQGSILSVTLFAIKINSIVNCLLDDINGSLYVDDFQICFRGQNMAVIERQLQMCLNKLDEWSNENGFKFSISKTVCVHFCRKHKNHEDPKLFLNGSEIPVVPQVKFLGLIFDNKLNFMPHITYIKEKCKKALNILKVVSHMDWGADSKVLIQLYKSLILSKLDYGSFIYGSAPKSYIRMLDPIQNEGLRLCLGAYKTSPARSLEVQAGVLPLKLRREQLALQYILKLRANPNNPAYKCIFHRELTQPSARRYKTIPTLRERLEESLSQSNINFENISTIQLPDTPPWSFDPIYTYWNLALNLKSDTCPTVYKSEFYRIKNTLLNDHHFLYTDGSKQDIKAASAACDQTNYKIERMLDYASIFSAELNAIILALEIIEFQHNTINKFVICSDSQSALQAIEGSNFQNPFLIFILEKLQYLRQEKNKSVCFLWIPSHIGIPGNEVVDKFAKRGLGRQTTNKLKLPHSDCKPLIKPFIHSKWQNIWNDEIDKNKKLREIQPSLNNIIPVSRKSRREELILNRLRIGHTYFTHSFIRKREPPPECISCDCVFSVKHIMLECAEYSEFRRDYIKEDNIKDLFETSHDDIISFIKETGLYLKI